MKRRPPRRYTLVLAAAVITAGCGAPLTMSQQLAGEWVGRPESAAERTVREWPTLEQDPDDPEIAAAAAAAPPTDLESFAGVRVAMQLDESGDVQLTLAGKPPLTGEWTLSAVEGRRAVLDLRIERGDDAETENRRFDIEVLKKGEGFVLREQGADRRFGRLLFLRPGDETPAANAPPNDTLSNDAAR